MFILTLSLPCAAGNCAGHSVKENESFILYFFNCQTVM
jgi:hypothetical protein